MAEKITAEELAKLSEMTHIKEDVIRASGLSDERLKELYDVRSDAIQFHKNVWKGLWVGVGVIPGAMLGLSYAFNGAANTDVAFSAVGVQLATIVGALAVMIGRDIKYRHDPNAAAEIRKAADERLIAQSKSSPAP